MPCLVALVGFPLSAYGLYAWARWLRRWTLAPRIVSWIGYALAGLVVFAPAASLAVMLFVLMRGEAVDRSGHAPQALNVDIDLSVVVGVLAPLPVAALWLLLATWRWHWAARSPVVRGDPPYR